jgi:hypothetical protein
MLFEKHISVRTVSRFEGDMLLYFVQNIQKTGVFFYLKTLLVVHIIQIRVRENLFFLRQNLPEVPTIFT